MGPGAYGASVYGGTPYGGGAGAAATAPSWTATAALVFDAVATGSIRYGGAGTAALVFTASATAANYANGAAAVGETTEAATLTLSAFATGSVITPVLAPPAGSSVAPIKRVSITMPAPVLDAQGRPT